jgi:thiamine pyrophosphate-dependent acetolactate synthase large subunit-like protein
MSDKLTQVQEGCIELSEQDLETVAGGVAGVSIDVGSFAQGSELAFTNTQAFTGAFSNGIASVGAGIGAGVSVSVNKPSLP